MGCERSKCCRDQRSELEVDVESGFNYQQQRAGAKRIPLLPLKDRDLAYSPTRPRESLREKNSKASLSPEHESTKNTKWEGLSALNSSLRNSVGPAPMTFPTQEVFINIGKSPEQLQSEYIALERGLKSVLRIPNISDSMIQDINRKLARWHSLVYLPICKKTSEIKSSFAYGFSLSDFSISHEVTAWNNLDLLTNFCDQMQLAYDQEFLEECKKKIKGLAALSITISLEIHLTEATIDAKRINAEYCVSVRVSKPFSSGTISKLLQANVERDNLIMWHDAHQLMCSDFGFYLSSKENIREMQIGCYIFGGLGKANLQRALSAFQSYGAELKQTQLDLFSCVPSEEFKILFLINENGVTKIRMMLKGVKESVLQLILEAFPQKNCDVKKINSQLAFLSKENLIEDHGATTHYIEFSADGFKVGCETRVGEEHGSMIYLDTC